MESYFSLGIVSGAEDAIIGEDLNGTIRFWNKGAERLLGYSQTEAVGQSIELIVPTDRLTEDADLVKTLLAGEVIASFGTVRVNKAGLWLSVSVSISPIVNPEGIIIGASKTLRDISRNADIELLSIMKSYADNTKEEIISNRTALAAATEELERSAASIIQIQKALQKLTADNLVSLESNSAKIQEATAQLEKKSHRFCGL